MKTTIGLYKKYNNYLYIFNEQIITVFQDNTTVLLWKNSNLSSHMLVIFSDKSSILLKKFIK